MGIKKKNKPAASSGKANDKDFDIDLFGTVISHRSSEITNTNVNYVKRNVKAENEYNITIMNIRKLLLLTRSCTA